MDPPAGPAVHGAQAAAGAGARRIRRRNDRQLGLPADRAGGGRRRHPGPDAADAALDPRAAGRRHSSTSPAGFVRRYLGGKLSIDVQHDLRHEVFATCSGSTAPSRTTCRPARSSAGRSPTSTWCRACSRMLPMHDRQRAAVRDVGHHHVHAVAAADAGRAAGRPGAAGSSPSAAGGTLFPANWDAQQRAGEVAGVVEEAVTGVRVVKGFGQEQREVDRLDGAARGLFASGCGPSGSSLLHTRRCRRIPALGQVAVLALGGWLALQGTITPRHVPGLLHLPGAMVAPVRCSPDCSRSASRPGPASSGCSRCIDSTPRRRRRARTPSTCPTGPGRASSFDDVTFGYTADSPVLDGFDLHGRAPARRVALVGTAGSGKSTVVAAAPPLLRRRTRARSASTASTCATLTLESLRERHRRGLRGQLPVLRHHRGQHRLRPARRHRGRDRGRGPGRPRPTSSSRDLPDGLRHRGRRAGAHPVRRPAPAGRPGPGAAHRPAAAAARRRHLGGRRPDRGRDPRRPCAGAWPAAPRSSSPTAARTLRAGRPHRRARRRPGGRRRHPRGADRRAARCYRRSCSAGDRRRGPSTSTQETAATEPDADAGRRRHTVAWTAAGPRPATRSMAASAGARAERRARYGSRRRAPAEDRRRCSPRLPPTPELLAEVAALPPADDAARRRPDAACRRPDPDFRFRAPAAAVPGPLAASASCWSALDALLSLAAARC